MTIIGRGAKQLSQNWEHWLAEPHQGSGQRRALPPFRRHTNDDD